MGTCIFTSIPVRTPNLASQVPYPMSLCLHCSVPWQTIVTFHFDNTGILARANIVPPSRGTPNSEDKGSLLQWNTENVCTLFCFLHFLCRASQHFTTSDKSDVWWTMFYKNKLNNHMKFKRLSFDVSTFQHSCHVTFCHTIKQECE
jgi:hypothetical protein